MSSCMKTRISLLLMAVLFCHVTVAQVHISVPDPETWTTDELTPYIGQTVIFDCPIVVSSNASSTSLTVSPRRLFTPTNQAFPRTDEYRSVASLNGKGAMDLTGVSGYHRCGEKIYNLKAKVNDITRLSYISGEFRGNTRAELEAGIPDVGDYRILVCTMNLEYYLTIPVNNGMGPSSVSAHEKQRTKVIKALTRINADLYGFIEIATGNEAAAEIATYLNQNLPDRNYTYVSDNSKANGSDIKAAFVYDRNKLKIYGDLQEIGSTGVKGRKKMQCFEERATGERFWFSVNHYKAKSGSGSGMDADQHDGQGQFNATRTEESQAVVDLYRQRLAPQSKEKDILIMGDLNAYAREDPIKLFLDNSMIDLHRAFHADSSYSYQFGGLAGYLDHAICNTTLFPQVTGAAGFHINSDENDRYTYDKSNDLTMFRCSDHDPVLVGLKLNNEAVYDPKPVVNTMDILSGNARKLIISDARTAGGANSYYAIFDISGRPVSWQTLIEQNDQEVDLPSAPGVYVLYVYFDGTVYRYKFIVR